jgi:hypothetical protein
VSFDHGPIDTYEVIWNSGHVEYVQAHQVLMPQDGMVAGLFSKPRTAWTFHGSDRRTVATRAARHRRRDPLGTERHAHARRGRRCVVNKIRRAWPLAKLITQFGFAVGAVLLLVAWFCGARHLVVGVQIGMGVIVVAGVVGLLVLAFAPLVVDEDNRGPGGRR